MARATITSKGQITIPKEVRERLGLETGDRIEIYVEPDGRAVIERTLKLEELADILPRPSKALSVEEINQAIAEAAAKQAMRGL
jgi:AbrB family looped-hinge helix DNA binding protein